MKYLGKEKCRILRQIRAEIAKQNDIEWVVEECPHQGDCPGTCPKCENEVRQLEEALQKRAAEGKKVSVICIAEETFLKLTVPKTPAEDTDDWLLSSDEDADSLFLPEPMMGEMEPLTGDMMADMETVPFTEDVMETDSDDDLW